MAEGEAAAGSARRAAAAHVPGWLDASSAVAGRVLVLGLAVAAALWLLVQVQFLALALVLGFAQVAVLAPLVRWLVVRHVPQAVAAIIAVAAFATVFLALFFVALREIAGGLAGLPQLIDRAAAVLEDALGSGWFDVDRDVLVAFFDQIQSMLTSTLAAVAGGVIGGVSFLASLVAVLSIAVLFAVFCLASGQRLWRAIVGLFALDRRQAADDAGSEALRVTGAWFYAATITGAIDSIGIGLGLFLLDVPLVAPIMVLTFILGYIPMVGATIAGAVAVVVALASGGLATGLAALGVVLLVQQIESNVLAPLLLSKAVSFHPVVTLLLTMFAALLLGTIGMFLVTPLAGAIVAAVRTYRRPLAATPG